VEMYVYLSWAWFAACSRFSWPGVLLVAALSQVLKNSIAFSSVVATVLVQLSVPGTGPKRSIDELPMFHGSLGVHARGISCFSVIISAGVCAFKSGAV
jgi:hypothetical protein